MELLTLNTSFIKTSFVLSHSYSNKCWYSILSVDVVILGLEDLFTWNSRHLLSKLLITWCVDVISLHTWNFRHLISQLSRLLITWCLDCPFSHCSSVFSMSGRLNLTSSLGTLSSTLATLACSVQLTEVSRLVIVSIRELWCCNNNNSLLHCIVYCDCILHIYRHSEYTFRWSTYRVSPKKTPYNV